MRVPHYDIKNKIGSTASLYVYDAAKWETTSLLSAERTKHLGSAPNAVRRYITGESAQQTPRGVSPVGESIVHWH